MEKIATQKIISLATRGVHRLVKTRLAGQIRYKIQSTLKLFTQSLIVGVICASDYYQFDDLRDGALQFFPSCLKVSLLLHIFQGSRGQAWEPRATAEAPRGHNGAPPSDGPWRTHRAYGARLVSRVSEALGTHGAKALQP